MGVINATAMFNLEEKSLSLCEVRSALLARNIANSNTPNFKARDLNFHEALNSVHQSNTLTTTHSNHLQSSHSANGNPLYYRVPTQISQDGNTVDDEIERKNFIENALRYQASLGFVQNKAGTLLKAIKGE